MQAKHQYFRCPAIFYCRICHAPPAGEYPKRLLVKAS